MRRNVSKEFFKEYAHLLDEQGHTLTVSRKETTVEHEANKRKEGAHEFLRDVPNADEDLDIHQVKSYLPPTLSGAIFCGHLVTDLDSIAGAIGASELYGGYPARASEVNPETAFALQTWGVALPDPIESVLEQFPDSGVCLVDHQQMSQLNKSIPVERIVGVIDHHALQNSTIVTDMPIYIDIRPWGSMSTIITHNFLIAKRRPTRKTAGMLLCAILSDTLNLQGPTTTEWDRLMVAVLVEICQVEDVQFLASQQFKAKSSELASLTSAALVNGDQKVFTFKTEVFDGSVGFAVIETTDDEVIMARQSELLAALADDKAEKGLSLLYLAVVNIVTLRGTLLCIGGAEASLAAASFAEGRMVGANVMDLGPLVSRKKDYIPAVTRAIKGGWCYAASASNVFSLPADGTNQ